MKKEDLDRRICDVEEGATNKETYREFIMNSLYVLYGKDTIFPILDNFSEEDINSIIEELDYLLDK